MTIHAPIHGHLHPWFRWRFFTLSNLSVAGLALYLPYHGMTAMGKKDVIRLFVYPFPGNFLTLLLKLPDFFLFCGLCDGIFMTFEACVEVRHPGEGLGSEETVACITPQTLFQMLFVIERDGLLGFRAKTKTDEKGEQKSPDGQSNEEKLHS